MFIEMAVDTLKSRDPAFLQSELKQFYSLGPGRLSEIVNTFSAFELPGEPNIDDLSATVNWQADKMKLLAGIFYLLGLETARVLLTTMPAAANAGLSDIL
jgi:hypothetical protein